jgi:CubicO group peptidase (beta-lactamase class C family)
MLNMKIMKYKNLTLFLNVRWRYIAIIIIFMIQTLFLYADGSFAPDTNKLDNFLRKTVKTYNIPGLAVAVVDDKGVIFMSGYGESSPGFSVTPNTPFLLGSTTKMFTALATMRLVEMGKVEIDSALKKYLPEFRLASPDYENAITIRHLLNQTSGMSDAGMPYVSLGENSLDDELILLRKCKPVSAPGKVYSYFNSNYRLLGLVIEKVSGMRYGEFIYSEIFKPLAMTSSFVGPVGVKDLTTGHGEIFGFPLRREQKIREGAFPSGFIVSSVSDIANLLIAELRAGKGDSSILDPKTIKMTWQPPQNIKGGYAMGWLAVDTIGKTPFLAHGGSLENYQSFLYINPQLNTGFVFLMNQGGLLPMIGGFNTLRNGFIRIIDKEQPEDGPGLWPVFLVLVCFLLILALEVFITIRLKTWQNRTGQKKRWKRWTGMFLEIAFTCFLLYWLYKGGYMFYNLLPESFLLLWIMIILGIIRSLVKIWIIIKNPGVLFNK